MEYFLISVPSSLLFVILQRYGEVGFLSLDDNPADTEFSLIGKSRKPAAVTYDPVSQVCSSNVAPSSCLFQQNTSRKHTYIDLTPLNPTFI